MTRPAACAATRPSSCSIPTRRPSTGQVQLGSRRSIRYRPRATKDPQRCRLRAAHAQGSRHQPLLRLARRPPARDGRGTRRSIYEVHVKGFTARHPGIPEELRGTYAGLAHPAAIEHLHALGVTAVELMPVHQFVPRPPPRRAGAAQLLGLQLDRLPRAAQRVRGGGSRTGRGRSSRRWCGRCTRPGSRSSSTSSTTTPRRATTSARSCRSRDRQRRLLPPGRRRTLATTSTPPGPATA